MTARPLVEPLSYRRRKIVFYIFLVAFIVALPIIIFYTNGYRFDFSQDRTQIVSTGGLFIGVDSSDAEVYIDDELEQDLRIFQRGTYVQNLEAGVHQVRVEQEGLFTWVKDLPVQPFIVTEAQAFLMPEVPQVRLISQYEDANGRAVVQVRSLDTLVLPHASTTNDIVATTSRSTTSFRLNPEYIAVLDLFASDGATPETFIGRVADEIEGVFELGQVTVAATSTTELHDTELFEQGGDIYARWVGNTEDVPGYFCVVYKSATTTAMEYGEHVARSVEEYLLAQGAVMPETDTRVCRSEIRIDRKQQEVQTFDFFPDQNSLVLMHLTDGLHVVEVDDRGWQNTQMLYSGNDIDVRVDGNRIYVRDGDYLLEVFTELSS